MLDRLPAESNNAPVSKRKLNKQQSWRIERKQREREERAQRSDALGGEALAGGQLGSEQHGRVIARYGSQADVKDDGGTLHRCHLRANLGSVVAGDAVTFCAGEDTGVVVARDARLTALRRPDKFGKLRTVAANVDRVIIVIAPLPEPHGNLIDRYLVAAENLGAEAFILLNKTDLMADASVAASVEAMLAPYAPLGYPVLRAQGKAGVIEELTALLAGHTSILVGQSGVGKTTLVNALLPDARQRVGELSIERNKGRHTTTTARLFDLTGGGALIDSPGIREFGLWHMAREDVERGFREFRDRIGNCRFRDCRHDAEPGCALTAAIERGEVHPARVASYRHIISSLDLALFG